MTKRVLDVGNCDPDHASITQLLQSHFQVEVVRTHGLQDSLAALRGGAFDLVLVNRKLDRDYSDGIEIIKQLKADEQLATVPVMLITNYEDHQDQAVAIGAKRGFGKLQFNEPATLEKLNPFLA